MLEENRNSKKKNQFAVLAFTFSSYFILPPFLSDQLPSERTGVKHSGFPARKRLLMCSMRKQISGVFFFFFLLLLNLVRNIEHGGVTSTSRSAGRNHGATHASDRYSPSRCFAANWLRRRVAGVPTCNPVGGVAVIFSGLIRPAGDEEGTWEVERLHHPKVSKRMIPK